MRNLTFTSIIIPCRNEESFIGRCLDSIVVQDYPKEVLEVLVINGMSEDNTKKLVLDYTKKYPFIKLLENQRKVVPTALNIGINNSKGEIIIRMDGHNIYERDYVSKCVKYLNVYNADNVGGIWVTLPGNNTLFANVIAMAISSSFGVGNSYFRIGSKELKYVDTVPFGCYKREVFDKIGLFDEQLVRNQDDEFNLRLIKNGGKILLVPDIVSYYYARDSLSKVAKMYFQYGYFKPLVSLKVGAVLTWRQLIPALFIISLLGTLALSMVFKPFIWFFTLIFSLYIAANLLVSFSIACKKGVKYLFALPIVFSTIHFSYGLGYLKGIWDFIVRKKHLKRKIDDMPLTR